MNYSISVTSIIETMQAIASLYLMSSRFDGNSTLASTLFPERRDLLTALVKDAFAETLVDMLPYVSDSNLDSEESDEIIKFSIDAFDTFPHGIHSIFRRNIEQSIAYRVLYLCIISEQEKGIGSTSAEEISSKSTKFLSKALSLIRTSQLNTPFIR